jgi:hypothetical protein
LERKKQANFQGTNCKSLRSLGASIISLAKNWCLAKGDNFINFLHMIPPQNINSLPVQVLGGGLDLIPIMEGLVWRRN